MSSSNGVGQVVRVAADYDCFPLWVWSGDRYQNVSVASIPLSDGLREQLERWSLDYDATLNREDPNSSGFEPPDLKVEFADRGELLARKMKTELGSGWQVIYYNIINLSDIQID